MLEWAERATSTGVEFVAEQTPLYIQELLVYNFWISLICFLAFFIPLLLSIFLCWKVYRWLGEEKGRWDNEGACIFFFIFPFALFTWGALENADWLKIKLAPRVYIVDYLRTELKK